MQWLACAKFLLCSRPLSLTLAGTGWGRSSKVRTFSTKCSCARESSSWHNFRNCHLGGGGYISPRTCSQKVSVWTSSSTQMIWWLRLTKMILLIWFTGLRWSGGWLRRLRWLGWSGRWRQLCHRWQIVAHLPHSANHQCNHNPSHNQSANHQCNQK